MMSIARKMIMSTLIIVACICFLAPQESFSQGWSCYGNGEVWIQQAGEDPVMVNDDGEHACFSKDGKLVFFNRGDKIWAVKTDGTGAQEIGTGQKGNSGAGFCAYRPEPQSVLVRDGGDFYKIDVATKTRVLVVETNNSGIYGEIAISDDGTRMAARLGSPAALEIEADKTGTWSSQMGNCSASISPDGTKVTRNGNNHKEMDIRDFNNLNSGTTLANTGGGTWDNQRYSVNSNDWIAVVFDNGVGSNRGGRVGAHQISTNTTLSIGSTSGGDTQYPDFWFGDLPDPSSAAINSATPNF